MLLVFYQLPLFLSLFPSGRGGTSRPNTGRGGSAVSRPSRGRGGAARGAGPRGRGGGPPPSGGFGPSRGGVGHSRGGFGPADRGFGHSRGGFGPSGGRAGQGAQSNVSFNSFSGLRFSVHLCHYLRWSGWLGAVWTPVPMCCFYSVLAVWSFSPRKIS